MYNIIKLKEVDSTNEWIKRNREKLSDFDGVMASIQTAGKGRGSNTWSSPPGGLWLSIMIKEFSDSKGALSLLTSVSIAEALENQELYVELKWPNDIVVSSRKLGGILIEGINGGFIIGIGLNLNVELSEFPDSLKDKITTAREIRRRDLPIDDIAIEIMSGIRNGIDELDRIYARYLGLNQDIGRMVRIISPKETFNGRVIGIQIDGGIRIRNRGVERTFYSGSLIYV
ncbi:biotin--[acetyl-CoA-carboxylase] ligase [candidate division WOR-3 bacterium]|nr:biotin--[acetyl-CoA-carboxylase] ligase [candidate division WOR-3 bacterium]